MRKIILIFISIPIITLTVQANGFYEQIEERQQSNAQQYRKSVINQKLKNTYRNNQTRTMRTWNNRSVKRVIRPPLTSSYKNNRKVRSTTLDIKKFFYADRAAKNGNAKAQFDLAIMYATGKGIQKNERAAFNLFHKSARNNNVLAKHYMGLSFLQGRGVKKQMHLAKYWFRLAVKQGNRQSAYYLAQVERTLGEK